MVQKPKGVVLDHGRQATDCLDEHAELGHGGGWEEIEGSPRGLRNPRHAGPAVKVKIRSEAQDTTLTADAPGRAHAKGRHNRAARGKWHAGGLQTGDQRRVPTLRE